MLQSIKGEEVPQVRQLLEHGGRCSRCRRAVFRFSLACALRLYAQEAVDVPSVDLVHPRVRSQSRKLDTQEVAEPSEQGALVGGGPAALRSEFSLVAALVRRQRDGKALWVPRP